MSGSISRRSDITAMRSPGSGVFFLSNQSQPESDSAQQQGGEQNARSGIAYLASAGP